MFRREIVIIEIIIEQPMFEKKPPSSERLRQVAATLSEMYHSDNVM